MKHLRDSPEYRYRTDATFHTLVDSLEALLIHAHMTPSEIREAAVLAAIHHEEQWMNECEAEERELNRAIENRTAQEIDERRADDERMRHDS